MNRTRVLWSLTFSFRANKAHLSRSSEMKGANGMKVLPGGPERLIRFCSDHSYILSGNRAEQAEKYRELLRKCAHSAVFGGFCLAFLLSINGHQINTVRNERLNQGPQPICRRNWSDPYVEKTHSKHIQLSVPHNHRKFEYFYRTHKLEQFNKWYCGAYHKICSQETDHKYHFHQLRERMRELSHVHELIISVEGFSCD